MKDVFELTDAAKQQMLEHPKIFQPVSGDATSAKYSYEWIVIKPIVLADGRVELRVSLTGLRSPDVELTTTPVASGDTYHLLGPEVRLQLELL